MLIAIYLSRFTNDGRYIYVRDFMTIKMYDIAMPQRGPISTIPVHSHLSPYVWELYENDFLFDKFRLAASSNGAFVMTGSYG
jgi:serine/threonine-protein phosphatase 2A regulatory subunit B